MPNPFEVSWNDPIQCFKSVLITSTSLKNTNYFYLNELYSKQSYGNLSEPKSHPLASYQSWPGRHEPGARRCVQRPRRERQASAAAAPDGVVEVAYDERDVVARGDVTLLGEVVVVVEANHLVHHSLGYARQGGLFAELVTESARISKIIICIDQLDIDPKWYFI